MSGKHRTPKAPVPWYQTRAVVRAAGTIVGLLVFGWLSVFVVFHSARMSPYNPQPSGPSVDIDAYTFMTSFNPIFHASSSVESYYWPPESGLFERTEKLSSPIVIPSYFISDWELLYKWASGTDWIYNEAEYDFRVQNHSLFWTHELNQPAEATMPLKQLEGGTIEYLTMKRFMELELEEDTTNTKYRKFDGFVFRASDLMSEFPNAPKQEEFKVELRGRNILISAASQGIRTQPRASLDTNVICQAIGTTDWILSPPSQFSRYATFPLSHPLRLQSQLEVARVSVDSSSNSHLKTMPLSDSLEDSIEFESSHLDGLSDLDGPPIEVQYTRLRPGQILVVLPLWTAQMVASSTSVHLLAPLANHPLKALLSTISTHENIARITSMALEREDPQQDLNFRIQSIHRILAPFPRISWYNLLMQSYEVFHASIVVGKMNIAQQMVGKSCELIFDDLVAAAANREVPSQELLKLEEKLYSLVKESFDSMEKPEEKVIALSLAAESVIFGILQDSQLTHSFLHKCEPLWTH